MAIGNTGQNLDFSGGTGTTIATSATVTVADGSWVVAWVYYFDAIQTVTVSDGTNNLTAIPAGSPVNDGNSRLYTFARYYATGGTFTFTATYGAAVAFRAIMVAEVTGRASTALVAAQCAGQAQPTPGTGTDAVSTGNATPQSTASEIVAFALNDTSAAAPATGTGFTSAGTFWADTGDVARLQTRVLSSASAIAATWTAAANVAHLSSQIIFDDAATSTADQEGARFGLDDGSESAHTFSQAQDANESTGLSVARLIRMLINGTGDLASTTYTLRYQKNGAGGYVAVPVGANTAPTLSWGAAGTIAYSASAGTTVAPTYPSGITTNSMLVLIVGQKPGTANGGTVTTPSGWTLRGSLTGAGGYGATLAADTGNTNLFVYTKDTITGSESGTLTVTIGNNGVTWANIYRVQASDRCTWTFAVGTGSDTSAGSVSIATGSMDVAAGDHVIGAMCIPTDVTTPAQFSAHALAQTGTTFGTVNEVQEPDSTVGNDIGGYVIEAAVSSGSGSGAVTMSATAGGTTTNVRGPGLVIRLRAASVANEIYVSPSSNIAAGGEATTARLTAPAGKSTADFVTGRRWDDENGSDATDVTTDDYTEVEWSLAVQSPAVAGDYYDLRVYAGAAALASYTVTPRWTIAGTDPFPLPHRPITGVQLNALLRM